MSRFGLLAGTTAEGVDPAAQAWSLSPLGWFLALLPFLAFAAGRLVGDARVRGENVDTVADLVS